jgi:hypothetical protein
MNIAKILGFKKKKTFVPPVNLAQLPPGYDKLREYVLDRIRKTPVGTTPFYHSYIEELFPAAFYDSLAARMLQFKNSGQVQDRTQDNATYVNRRFPLAKCTDPEVLQFRALFEDTEVKLALFQKYYEGANERLANSVEIHQEEFEFVFCEPDRFQNIHVDIPPKYMSFVFYFPTEEISADEEEKNATVLYDKSLEPVYGARFKQNSVCVFVPHFYSYHGFSSTRERDVIVMFLVSKTELDAWNAMRKSKRDTGPEYEGIANLIEDKLNRHPLIEYGSDPERVKLERDRCQINAPQGRVMID